MGKITIHIESGGRRQEPVIIEGVTWETARKGEPGKLTFTCIKDENLSFSEGAPVKAYYGETGFFHGYVFQKQRNKDQHIQVTAYDQIRYLKAKSTFILYGIRADQIVKRIAEDFKLEAGILENTGYVIPKWDSQNQTVLDGILDAVDETVMNTGKLFYLYDDFGKLTLKNINSSQTDFLINDTTAEDFDYTTSIDNETYNRILLYNKSATAGESQKIIEEDLENIQKWGALQYFDEVKKGENARAKAKALLKMHNRVFRTLRIKNHFGDIRIRGGSGVYLDLNLGDKVVSKQRMLVEKATHTFNNDEHFMDLDLQGREEFYG